MATQHRGRPQTAPNARAVARLARAVTETLEGRTLLAAWIDRLDFGNLASEAAHHFAPGVPLAQQAPRGVATVGASSGLTFRNPSGNPDLTFTVAVDPTRQNYLSVRAWGNDVPNDPMDLTAGGTVEVLEEGGGNVQFPNRFVYYTAAIPIGLTAGKTSVQLTLDAGRPVYDAYTHTTTMFEPDPTEPAGTKPTVTGEPTLDALTLSEAIGILQAKRQSIYNAGGYFDQVVARQVMPGTPGAPPETVGLDLFTNVSSWRNANPSATPDDWRNRIATQKAGPGYTAFPDELLGVLTASYLLPKFTDAGGNVVAGLDRYHDSTLITRIVSALDGASWSQGSNGGFPTQGGDWIGLVSSPRVTGDYAGQTGRLPTVHGGGSLQGVDTYALGWTLIQLLNDPTAAPILQSYLGQSYDADLNGGSVLRATAYQRMLFEHVNYCLGATGGTHSQNMFQELAMYAASVALTKLQTLFPNATYAIPHETTFNIAKEIMGLRPTSSGMRGVYAGSLENFGMTRKGFGEAHGALSTGYDGGGYGSIIPWLSVRFAQVAAWDPNADAASVDAMREMASITVDSYDQFLSPLERATVNGSGVVTSVTRGWGPEPYITYRDTKNVNTYANGLEFNDQYLASDPTGVLANAYALRSAYLSTQYGLTTGNGSGGGGRALNYLRDYSAYESTIRSLINVDPATLTPLPAEPGQPDFAWADVQAGAVAFVNNGQRFYANLDWRNYEYNGGFTNLKHSNVARVHFTTDTIERAGQFIMPKDAANVQADGNLTGLPIKSAKVLRYGDYLIVLNDGPATYTATLPAGEGVAKDLASGAVYGLGGAVNVPAGQHAILWLSASSVVPALPNAADVGAVGTPGSNAYAGGVYTVRGAGADVGGSSDAFRLVSTTATGDATITARVMTQTGSNAAEAGVMVRADATANSPFAAVLRSPGNGLRFEYRTAAGADSAWVAVATPLAPVWVKLTRTGITVAGYYSTDNVTWTQIGTAQPIALPSVALLGLAVASHATAATSTATFDDVSVDAGAAPTVAAAATAPSQTVAGTSVNLSVLGADDAGEAGLTYTWAVVGQTPGPVSFSADKSNAAKNTVATFTTAGAYTLRAVITDAGGATTSTDVTVTVVQTATAVVVTAPVTLLPQGGQTPAYATVIDQFGQPLESPPATTWSVDAGGAGGSVDASGLYTAPPAATGAATLRATAGSLSGSLAFTVQAPLGVLSNTQAIGSPALPGSASYNSGTYTVSAGGNDIWGTSDQFRFVYLPLTGDGQITARVASMGNTHTFAKAGVMFRTTLDANSPHAINWTGPANGTHFEYRNNPGGTSAGLAGGSGNAAPPMWVRLTRVGSVISAAHSTDGVTWTTHTATASGVSGMTAGSTVYVGLVVCSHNTSALNTATFDNVTVTEFRNRAVGGTATATPAGSATESAAKAFDGSVTTKWYGSPGTGAVIRYDFGTGVKWAVARYEITSANDVPARDPKDWQLQGSDDGVAWTMVDTRTGQTFAARYQTNTYVVANPTTPYQFYRLNVTANAGNSGVGVQLAELEFVTATAPRTAQGAPTFANPAGAAATTVTGTTVNLSALGSDNGGEPSLVYVWDLVNLPPGDVTFGANRTNAAKSTVATFTRSGVYTFRVTAIDAAGQGASSLVTVTVTQTPTAVSVSPASPVVGPGGVRPFTAVLLDQFGQPVASQPASFTWSLASGAGSINASGVYAAAASTGSAVVRAAAGAVSGTTGVTVTNQAPLVQNSTGATATQTSGTSAALAVPAVDDTGEPGLTYTWSVVGTPPSPVTFSANGTNGASSAVATFSAPGTYTFQVTITDAGGFSTVTSVSLTAAAAPALHAVTVNDGSAQRSMVKSLTITFSEPVTLAAGSLTLARRSTTGGAATPVTFTISPASGTSSSFVLTFGGTGIVGGSLADGIYDLTIDPGGVTNAAGLHPPANATQTFHRLFGDSDGNRAVNNADHQRFKAAFGPNSVYNAMFDYDANGAINNADYLQFKNRVGVTYTY